jgi:hypothetical protein
MSSGGRIDEPLKGAHRHAWVPRLMDGLTCLHEKAGRVCYLNLIYTTTPLT